MKDNMISRLATTVRRSFSEFLFVPSLEVAAFTALAVLTCMLDASAGPKSQWGSVRSFLDRFTGDTSQANNLLSTVATSLVTVSSITFSILLLAVQQSSAALTNQIVDQYLRRRSNQWFFGLFVGSSVYALACLGLTREGSVPVMAASLSLVLAIACLMSLIILIYSTLDQTRPSTIISSIHDSALRARREHLACLQHARAFRDGDDAGEAIASEAFGYVTWIDVDRLARSAKDLSATSIGVPVAVGDPVFVGQPLLYVQGAGTLDASCRRRLRGSINIERRRDLRYDPCFGVDQLSDIGWTSISTAKSNPAAANVACHALNDLLYQWSDDGSLTVKDNEASPVALRDRVVEHLSSAYESLMIVSSESLQHQSLAIILAGLAECFGKLVSELQERLARRIGNILSSLGDHVPSTELERAVSKLVEALSAAGKAEAATSLKAAWEKLAAARGELHSRSNRSTAWKA